jgi:hypothetical protein
VDALAQRVAERFVASNLDHAIDWWINGLEHLTHEDDPIAALVEVGVDKGTAKHMWDSYKKLPREERLKFTAPRKDSDYMDVQKMVTNWYHHKR